MRYVQTIKLEARHDGGKRYVVVDSETDEIVRGSFRTYEKALKVCRSEDLPAEDIAPEHRAELLRRERIAERGRGG